MNSALERLRRRGHRTALPAILLSNVRSLANKTDELQLLLGKNRDFSASSVLCFTETWLCGSIPDSALQLAGFQLVRADRDARNAPAKRAAEVYVSTLTMAGVLT